MICAKLLSRKLLLGLIIGLTPTVPAQTPVQTQAGTQETRSAPELVSSESPRSTSRATFTVPAGWSIINAKDMEILRPPEGDAQIVIFDSQAADAKAAVTAAWQAYKPETNRPLKLATPVPARDGWEESQAFLYESSPNEHVVVQAIALRSAGSWTVLILDGNRSTFEKRAAPTQLIVQSLRPKGYQKESFAGRKAHPLDSARIEELKSFVQNSMKQLGVPGVSLALIDGNKTVFEAGLGVRELGHPEPVDENTLFMAASNTKALTTLLLAELVDEKKLRWDEPVIEAYPPFKLGDADTTKRVLVKHLVCACTGLPRQDMEWIFEFKNITPESTLALLAKVQPTSKFGEVFQYSNLMASAAGYIGGHVVYPNKEFGAAYDEAMQRKIFAPLRMNSTTFSMARALHGNHAAPHGDNVDGTPSVANIAFDYAVVANRPAGGMWTSAHDLIRYVQLELNQGKLPDGRPLVSGENLLMRRQPQIALGENQSYGMGLMADKTYGVLVVHHGGDLAGYHSDMIFLPDYGVGAVLLTNADKGVLMRGPFLRRLLEVLFDGKPEASDDLASAAAISKNAFMKERERLVVPADASLVKQLAAQYHSNDLGDLDVLNSGSATVFDFGEWKSQVASRKNDDGTISFVTIDPTNSRFNFVVAERDGKRALIIRDGQHEYVFTEVSHVAREN